MSDTGLLAVLLAGIAGVLAGRAWAAALRRGGARDQPAFRASPHYVQGLHYLAAGRRELATSELSKVAREEPDAVEVLQVLGDLQREAGQVERAIQTHQALLTRGDLTRAERAHTLACLGADFRRAGFLDRATRTFGEVLEIDPKSLHALAGLQRLYEDQRRWGEAYAAQTRLSRLRKSDDSLVLGYLQAEMGREALSGGQRDAAEKAFRTALSLDRRVFPAHLGLADLYEASEPRKAAALLEEAIQISPERAYLAFDRLARLYASAGEPSRFAALCERIIGQDPQDWRARLALARHVRAEGRSEEAHGLLVRALESNPQVLVVHLEMWRTLRVLGEGGHLAEQYIAAAEASVFYRDPHVCTVCRYRADDMLWRCPHCHEWNTFVEERLGPLPR
ncbi:MAG TPA: tetratricopeptide repeat protein [Vicinamibacteria bacterium]